MTSEADKKDKNLGQNFEGGGDDSGETELFLLFQKEALPLVQSIQEQWGKLEDMVAFAEEKLGRSLTAKELSAFGLTLRYGKPGNQWLVNVNPKTYDVSNPHPDTGSSRFYEMHSGQYNNPVYTIEPSLAFPVPAGVKYVSASGEEVRPQEKIGGIICQNPDGSAVHRTSLSSPKAPEFSETTEGIEIDGEVWYLHALISKDKNRAFNYDAIYRREKPSEVKVVELQDAQF